MSRIKDIKWRLHVWVNLLAAVWLPCCMTQLLLLCACHTSNTVNMITMRKSIHVFLFNMSMIHCYYCWMKCCSAMCSKFMSAVCFMCIAAFLSYLDQPTDLYSALYPHTLWWRCVDREMVNCYRNQFQILDWFFSRVEMKKWRNYTWLLHFDFFSLFYFFAVSNLF